MSASRRLPRVRLLLAGLGGLLLLGLSVSLLIGSNGTPASGRDSGAASPIDTSRSYRIDLGSGEQAKLDKLLKEGNKVALTRGSDGKLHVSESKPFKAVK